MSHNLGPLIPASLVVGPDSGDSPTSGSTWSTTYTPPPDSDPTRFVILHFTGASLPGTNRLEVDLGYDTDTFTSSSGGDFWTRPVNVPAGGIPIRYIASGAPSGSVTLSQVGRFQPTTSGTPGTYSGSRSNPDIFLQDSPYDEPDYETRGICGPVDWDNAACYPSGTVQAQAVAASCILVMVHGDHVSSCSGALIDDQFVLTAGHCFDTPGEIEIHSGSVTFDYQTNCDGTRPAGHNPVFHKIRNLIRLGTSLDYAIVQIDVPPGGLGITPRPLFPGLPAVGDEVFLVHHPIGAVKKITSGPSRPPTHIVDFDSGRIYTDGDLAGGSSGSPLFDLSGNVIGVNVTAPDFCRHGTETSAAILADLASTPPPPTARDVMIVFDRSGSMSLSGSVAGKTKMQEAQEAAELFVDLVRTASGHQAGLVSFSTSASSPVDFTLNDVTPGNKIALIGPPGSGVIGGLSAGGMTSIGDGLQAGQNQLGGTDTPANKPFILLLTDGLENTPPMISTVESMLGGTDLCIVGFGTEASLDGPLLSRLAIDHNGGYTRATTGLTLKKFFVLCFGNIFTSGSSLDPEFFLPADEQAAEPVDLPVCGEELITVVLGWDVDEASLELQLRTPGGATIDSGSPSVESGRGSTYAYLRVPLPILGERDGSWQILVERAHGGDIEFQPTAVDVNYFVSTVVTGGPRLSPLNPPARVYTGDPINPLVSLMYPDGTRPEADVSLEITSPSASSGNILTESGLGAAAVIDGDHLNARTATLISLESASPSPLIPESNQTIPLHDDGLHGDGAMEPDGIYGNPLNDLTKIEGTYSFRASAEYGQGGCQARRETSWSIHVVVGVDPDQTTVTTETGQEMPDGRVRVRVTITPKDKFGNHLGPGRLDAFTLTGAPDSEPVGPVKDNGDGSYQVDVAWDPDLGRPPGVIVNQPDRPPVIVTDDSVVEEDETGAFCRVCWILVILLLILAIILAAALLS